MKNNNISVLIDCAAYFKEHSGKYIAEIIFVLFDKERSIFYLDNNSNQFLIDHHSGNSISFKYIEDPLRIGGVYTEDKIVGVDIKIPPNVKFITTINHKLKLTQLSQAIFRARKINLAHYMNFYYDDIFF